MDPVLYGEVTKRINLIEKRLDELNALLERADEGVSDIETKCMALGLSRRVVASFTRKARRAASCGHDLSVDLQVQVDELKISVDDACRRDWPEEALEAGTWFKKGFDEETSDESGDEKMERKGPSP